MFASSANHCYSAGNKLEVPVRDPSVSQCIDDIYASVRDDNHELDQHIAALKAALAREGLKEAVFDPTKLAQNNRQGRKFMQSYFWQRGVTVSFSSAG